MSHTEHTDTCAGCRKEFTWHNYNQVWFAGGYPCCSKGCKREADAATMTALAEAHPDLQEVLAT